jgi:hypothetical protein
MKVLFTAVFTCIKDVLRSINKGYIRSTNKATRHTQERCDSSICSCLHFGPCTHSGPGSLSPAVAGEGIILSSLTILHTSSAYYYKSSLVILHISSAYY